MKKMFLASSFSEVSNELLLFEKNVYGKTVTFIPTASNVEKIKFYVADGRNALEKMGAIVDVVDVSVEPQTIIEQKIKENDFIYVTGGNSFYLMQELKKSGADAIIKEEIENGKLYIGESAGAIILSNSISYIEKMDTPDKGPDLNSHNGLGIVEFYSLPHYNEPPFKNITKDIKENFANRLLLCSINNRQAILVEGTKRKIVTKI
ncbi:Type 1 glutamine amidotransferase-like domain-containing protein [Enterococcus sp. DIV0187]|uniref:Type 1 glutamine amidotransferase-like domain-containing protein n=1 Tax=Enterococcus sp. DIV0187 TaxID=2774644 RepID=UPI003F259C27